MNGVTISPKLCSSSRRLRCCSSSKRLPFSFWRKGSTALWTLAARSSPRARLIENRAPYDPLILVSLKKVLGVEAAFDRKNLMLSELREKMILAEDVYTIENPKKLIAKDYELSGTIIETLKKYDSAHGLKQPIQVLVPLAKNGSG